MRARKRVIAVSACLGVLGAGAATAAVLAPPGRIGPEVSLLANGRQLTPQGKLVPLGNFPTGGALTRDGRYYWTVSTGRGRNDIRIVSIAGARVIQTIPLPGASGGIAMDPTRSVAYVSGVPDSDHKDQQVPNAPGRQGEVVHVLAYGSDGQARETGVIGVPPPSNAPTPQTFPPTNVGQRQSWPDRLAISSDGRRLLVPLNLADAAAIVDVASQGVRYVSTGRYPYGAAILRGGRIGLVSNEATGTVSVIDLDAATKVKDIQVGSHLSHPEAIVVDPRADRAYVAIANSDQVTVIDTRRLEVERTLSTARPEGEGTSPTALSVTPDGSFLLAAESGADELAVFKLPGGAAAGRSALTRRAQSVLDHEARAVAARHPGAARGAEPEDQPKGRAGAVRVEPAPADFSLVGRIPVAAYPADVQVAPAVNACATQAVRRPARRRASRRRRPARRRPARRAPAFTGSVRGRARRARPRARPRLCSKLLWTAGKGLGVGPNPRGPNPYTINDDNANSQSYLPTIVFGRAGVLDFPSVERVRQLTPEASRQIRPSNAQAPPPGTPLRPDGPIKHVFYIVKENRTYDQILGDDPRGDGDPGIALFGRQVTPNTHALAQRFPLLDHVYANSEASIDGHFWTSAAKVSDYVHKNWNQNYAARKRPYDFGVFSITWPQNRFLFDQAERQGISYFNFGEAIAGTVPLTDRDRTPEETQQVATKFSKSDLGRPVPGSCYPNDAYIAQNAITMQPVFDGSPPPGESPTAESRADCFRAKFGAQVATNAVPAFTYLVLTNDHTVGGTAGRRSPRAMVADNDFGVGQIVDTISHSPVWKQSAIFIIEDDSQDGADHVDAHRIPAAVISPYARHDAVVHTRYDFLSVIRSMELIIGMRPLGLFDNLATPMYDAFQPTPSNGEPYDVIRPTWDRNERNPAGTAADRMSRGLNLRHVDANPQRLMDRILWKTVYGDRAEPPPPGPNAQAGG